MSEHLELVVDNNDELNCGEWITPEFVTGPGDGPEQPLHIRFVCHACGSPGSWSIGTMADFGQLIEQATSLYPACSQK